jgi:hypothetical protein
MYGRNLFSTLSSPKVGSKLRSLIKHELPVSPKILPHCCAVLSFLAGAPVFAAQVNTLVIRGCTGEDGSETSAHTFVFASRKVCITCTLKVGASLSQFGIRKSSSLSLLVPSFAVT